MKCQKCGTEHNENFCSNCGKKSKKPISKGRKIVGIVIVLFGLSLLFSVAINWDGGNTDSSSSGQTSQVLELEENQENETKGKVNYENFEKIENGMTYQQVIEIFGQEGKIMSEADIGLGEEYKTTLYYWYDNTGIANCNVTIQGGKVIAKAQVGLR